MRAWAFLPIAAAAALPASALAQDPSTKAGPPKGSHVDPKLQAEVNAAIAKGVAHLRTLQQGDGSFSIIPAILGGGDLPRDLAGSLKKSLVNTRYGETALALYALRACGVPKDDRDVTKGFAWLRKEYLRLKEEGHLQNYAVSLTLLALETHLDPPQDPDPGSDRYGKSVRRAPPLGALDLAWIRELTAWLVRAQDSAGGFGYVSPADPYHDHSNTQYSLLALKAARRCGVEVPLRVWEKALRHLLQCQEPRGPEVIRRERVDGGGGAYGSTTRAVGRDRARGWGYGDGDPATGSMTSAGVSSLAICRSELQGTPGFKKREDDEAVQGIRDGIAWLGLHFTVTENPGPPNAPMAAKRWHYYYLYGLERAGILAGVLLMAEHDWYREGAEYLVRVQHEDGGWSQDRDLEDLPGGMPAGAANVSWPSNLRDTCFALLFLKRATDRLSRAGTATGEELDLAGADALDDPGFRALFDRVFGRFAGAGADRRETLAADFVRLGTRSVPLLIRRLEDEDPAARAAAFEALRRTTGETLGFDPAAPDEERAKATARWEEWWITRGGGLAPDPAAGKFVTRR
jgi:hypothetical protein